jgi:Zinc-binding dehydrogenase
VHVPWVAGHRVVDEQRLQIQPYRLGASPPANAAPARLAAWSIGRAPPLGNGTEPIGGTAPDTRLPSYLCFRNTVNTVVPRTAVPSTSTHGTAALSQRKFELAPLLGGRKVLLNIARDDPRMASYFREMLESGAFRPLVDRQYPLDEIVEAYRYVETGRKIGNVVINVEPSASPREGHR